MPLRLNQSTLSSALLGEETSPVFAPTTKAFEWPASLADVKSYFGERPEPVRGFTIK